MIKALLKFIQWNQFCLQCKIPQLNLSQLFSKLSSMLLLISEAMLPNPSENSLEVRKNYYALVAGTPPTFPVPQIAFHGEDFKNCVGNDSVFKRV